MLYDENKLKIALNDPKLNFIYKAVKNIKNIKILEFGVKAGISTSLFLKLCEENEGYQEHQPLCFIARILES